MKEILFKYFVPTDTLYIELSKNRSNVGDIEYQDNVILFRDEKTENITGIEILNFNSFKENVIKVSDTEVKELTEPFRFVRMFISLQDIRGTDEFDKTLEAWGYKKIRMKKVIKELNIPFRSNLIKLRRINELNLQEC